MTTLTIEQGNNTETVSNAVIQRLYNIASNSTNVTLSGDLLCSCCYQNVYDYLTGYISEGVKRFPNLSLTVTNGRYATFADPVINDYWAKTEYGDGVGFPANSISSITTFPKRITQTIRAISGQGTASDAGTTFNNGRYAFYKDKNVTSFNELGLFSNITTIPTSMFRESTLKYIDLSNITTIEAAAFNYADLTGVVNIPNFKVWGGRSNSTTANMDNLYFGGNTHMTEIHLGTNIPYELKFTLINNYTFLNCSGLTNITGLSHVESIGMNAFKGCSSLENLQDLNTTTALTIGTSGFDGCSNLKCIDISKITNLGKAAFNGCSSLVALDTNDPDHINDNTEYTLNIYDIKENLFRGTSFSGKTLKFPNATSAENNAFYNSQLYKFVGTGITTVGTGLFLGCSQLLEVQLGNVQTLTLAMFSDCSNLTTIKLGNSTNDLTNFTDIPHNTFNNCNRLSLTGLTNILTIGLHAFEGCEITGNLNLPNLTSIGGAAFKNTGITAITDLGQITSIEAAIFRDCTQLLSVIIPGTVATINVANGFNGSGILQFIVKEGCTTVSMYAFDTYNGSIRYIEIPSTVTDIGSSFYNVSFASNPSNSLIIVIKAATPPSLFKHGNSSDYCYAKISKIYVPDDSVNAYKATSDGWSFLVIRDKITPISQLLTDNPTYWAVYQSGLSNS